MATEKLETVPVEKSNARGERMFVKPPYCAFGMSSIPESYSIIMKAGALRAMLDSADLDGDDSFRIEWFGRKATEFSFIKHQQ